MTDRYRDNFKSGTLGADLLTGATTINFGSDPGFPTIASPTYLAIIIDPEGAANGPEIVWLTAYTATSTTGTIARGQEGTSDPGVTHASGTVWRHGPTIEDFNRFVWSEHGEDLSGVAQVDIDVADWESAQIKGWLKPATDNVTLAMRLSNDGGVSFRSGAADYKWSWHYMIMGSTHSKQDSNGANHIQMGVSQGNATGEFISFDISLIGNNDSGVYTNVIFHGMQVNYLGQLVAIYGNGLVFTEEVNDYLRMYFSSGNIADGRIAVYGFPTP